MLGSEQFSVRIRTAVGRAERAVQVIDDPITILLSRINKNVFAPTGFSANDGFASDFDLLSFHDFLQLGYWSLVSTPLI